MNKKRTIYNSIIFWKIFGWIFLLVVLIISFTAFIVVSNYQATFSAAVNENACAPSAAHTYWTYFFDQSVIILILLFIISGFIVSIIARYFTIRINKILAGVNKISGGNLETKIEIDSNDEFSDLADNLNNLTIRLKEQEEKEKLISKIKYDFVTIATHRLRTPMSIIKWVFFTLKDDTPKKLNQEQLDLINKGVITSERMINLINDLLNISRIEEGKFGYTFIRGDFRQIFYEIEKIFRPQCDAAGIKLILDIYKNAVETNYDPDKMIMAINNIMSNAIKYTPSLGKINISASVKKGVIEIAVKDSGIGIPKEEQKSIFNSFFRGSNAMKIDTEASGLGLYIAKSIIEKHGGNIWFISAEKHGTTFYFTLPIKTKNVDINKSFKEFSTEL
ncbi:MAG: HAMP domain-containing sensor histidine kinase [Candidatus Falkowbacteria bacterium]